MDPLTKPNPPRAAAVAFAKAAFSAEVMQRHWLCRSTVDTPSGRSRTLCAEARVATAFRHTDHAPTHACADSDRHIHTNACAERCLAFVSQTLVRETHASTCSRTCPTDIYRHTRTTPKRKHSHRNADSVSHKGATLGPTPIVPVAGSCSWPRPLIQHRFCEHLV